MKTAIYINKDNKEQIKLWNKVGSKLVRWSFLGKMVNEQTGEVTGYLFEIKGLLKKLVERKNVSFIPKSQREIKYFKTN